MMPGKEPSADLAELIPGPDRHSPQRAIDTERQNRAFRACGLAALALGVVGFAPSVGHALLGTLWSVAHDAPHTATDFLGGHAVCAVVWTLAAVAQLCTGGVPRYGVAHRFGGYVGTTGLLLAMALAAANELRFATPGSALGSAYTLLLVLGASFTAIVGIVRAKQRRFPEHKDCALLAIMFTMDPAVHRLSMWTIRFIIGGGTMTADPAVVDPGKLLILGKMPANFILYVVFGGMFVRSRRVNRVTVLCTSFNLIAFIGGAILAVATGADGEVGPVVWGLAVAGTAAILSVTAAFVVVERRKRREESE